MLWDMLLSNSDFSTKDSWKKFCRGFAFEAIAGGAVIYVISDEGFKIEGYTWLLLYFVLWHQIQASNPGLCVLVTSVKVSSEFISGLLNF